MRIPQTPFMDVLAGSSNRSLINYLNDRVDTAHRLKVIPYIFSHENNIRYFNNIGRKVSDPQNGDPYKTGLPSFVQADPQSVWSRVIGTFLSNVSSNFATGFSQLISIGQSVRQFLTSQGLSFAEVNWLETFLDATGHFDQDLAEIVLEDWFFGGGQGNVSWVTIEGGMSRLIDAMVSLLRTPIKFGERVVSVGRSPPSKGVETSLNATRPFVRHRITNDTSTNDTDALMVTTSTGNTYTFSHVINTASLGALQGMDLTDLDLGFDFTSAVRMINYDDAMKVGIKFKTRWWQNLSQPIFGGQSTTDLPIRTVVYPSYGIDVEDAPGWLIASYVRIRIPFNPCVQSAGH